MQQRPLTNEEFKQFDTAFFGHPKPLFSLCFTEMWERFSFYGVQPLLILYMVALMNEGGLGLDKETAGAIVGLFSGALYLAALPGGWLADNWLGQKNAVWYGAIIIALGHLSIGLSSMFGSVMFYLGLVFIVVGTGLFKTCVTVMVGTMYDEGDERRNSGFSLFYMGINLGAFIAPFVCGLFMENYGWHWGFGIGGFGMLIALLGFRLHATPSLRRMAEAKNIKPYWEYPATNRHGVGLGVGLVCVLAAVFFALCVRGVIGLNVPLIASSLVYVIVASMGSYFLYVLCFSSYTKPEKIKLAVAFLLMVSAILFFAILEQLPTSFNLFAHNFTDRSLGNWEIPTPWFQSVQPLFVILFAPMASWLWVVLARRKMEISNINKFAIALIIAAMSYGIMYLAVQNVIANESLVSPMYVSLSMALLSLGEVFLSPIGLSSMTMLAPTPIRGQMMGLWYAGGALANLVAGLIAGNVSEDHIGDLPVIFMRIIIAVVVAAVVLLLLNKTIQRMLDKAQSQSE